MAKAEETGVVDSKAEEADGSKEVVDKGGTDGGRIFAPLKGPPGAVYATKTNLQKKSLFGHHFLFNGFIWPHNINFDTDFSSLTRQYPF